jgi:hypothetical protein
MDIDVAAFLNLIADSTEETKRDEFLLGIADEFYKRKVKM